MGDSIAERMDAGWQAARHWETECEAARNQLASVTAERDAYLETISATFRVLESRGQAPDDNAPLQVTVRRVLDFLSKVTAERDSWRQVHKTSLDHAEERENHHAETVARLTAERDNLKARVELLEAYARADATSALYVGTERDTLSAELAAMKKRLADAPKTHAQVQHTACWIDEIVPQAGLYALVRLEDGE